MKKVDAFYAAWNARNAEAVALGFDPSGQYVDPICRRPIAARDVAAHARRFLNAFSAMRFVVRNVIASDASAAVEWLLEAKCEGALDAELAAHGATVRIEGIDLFEWNAQGFTRARRSFDRRALADALGLQTIVEPIADGTMTFGYSVRDWVSKAKPGVLGLTWISARDEAEKAVIRGIARQIVRHFRKTPGFIGIITGFTGLHGFTLTAWESEAALRAGTQSGAHLDAMQAFHRGLSAGVFTSVWSPMRLNRVWSRCANGHAGDAARASGICEICGATLPEPPFYI